VYDLGTGRVRKVLLVDGQYPIYGKELERVASALALAPVGLFPRPTVVGCGIEMDKVPVEYRWASPAAVASFVLRAVSALRDSRVCYPDFHLGNLGGALGGPGVLLDPDALCDPWAGPVLLGHFSPIGEFTPAAVDRQPVTSAALGWYCTVFSACCTAVAARGDAGQAAAASFGFTQTRGGELGASHARLQRVFEKVLGAVSAPGYHRTLAALKDLESEAYDRLHHIAASTGCLHTLDAEDAAPPAVCPAACSPQ